MVELSYKVRKMVRDQVGHHAAAVYDVLAHHDTGDGRGAVITAQGVATESDLSEKTVRRAIIRLVDAGLVKCEGRFRDNRQEANRYRLDLDRVGASQPDRPGGQGDQAIGSTRKQVVVVVVDEQVLTSSIESLVMPGESVPATAGEGLRPSAADSLTQELQETEAPPAPKIRWTPRNSPMPIPLSVKRQEVGYRRYIDVLEHALWLVSYFEGYVLERDNRDYLAKGRKPREFVADYYKKKWLDNASDLVSAQPLEEVVHVIDRLFNVHFGFLPVRVAEYSRFPKDHKVTRIRQVEENYDLLVEEMHCGVDPEPVAGVNVASRPTINYGKLFADPAREAQVTKLVELFAQFRLTAEPAKEIHHTRTWRWAKSFRIMLANRGYRFEELKMVISALRDCPDMDRNRYNDAYDLDRDGEWQHVLSAANLARLRAELKASRRPAPTLDRPEPSLGRRRDNADEPGDGPRSLEMTSRTRRPPGYYSRNLTSQETVF